MFCVSILFQKEREQENPANDRVVEEFSRLRKERQKLIFGYPHKIVTSRVVICEKA